jgi:DNA-nicking Smr family endonuclease
MAKLTDLKSLLDAARAKRALGRQEAPSSRTREAAPSSRTREAVPAPDAARSRSVGPLPARGPARKRDDEPDVDFAQAFADVKRLPPDTRAHHALPRPAPIAKQRMIDDEAALEQSKYGAEPVPDAWDIGQELEAGQTFLRRGLSPDILTKLRRGHWSVQGELDLHGHTVNEAHDALSDFLVEAMERRYRCVRVVHGKGLTSPNRVPVLKGKVRAWLSRWDEVLAYCEAPPNHGGGGAVLILLRGK